MTTQERIEDLKQRAWGAGNRAFTVLGWLAGCAVAAGEYLDLFPEQYHSQNWYLIAMACVGLGTWWKKHVPAQLPAPLVLLAAGALLLALPARADDLSKLGGGCATTRYFGAFCAAPDMALAVVAFKHDGPTAGLMPGAGYKLSIFEDRWYTLGAGAYIALQVGAEHLGTVTALSSFAHYIRLGVAKDLYRPGERVYPVLGLGTDFGPVR